MSQQQQPYPPPYAPVPPTTPAPKAKKPRRWPWILGMFGTLVLGLIIGSASASKSPPTASSGATQPVTATSGAPAQAAPSSAAPAAPAGPKTSFGDGTYKVGEDIAPGTYKSAGPRDSVLPNCYWARLKNDSGSIDAIIANNGGNGPARVTVKAGEYLQVSGCDWTKA